MRPKAEEQRREALQYLEAERQGLPQDALARTGEGRFPVHKRRAGDRPDVSHRATAAITMRGWCSAMDLLSSPPGQDDAPPLPLWLCIQEGVSQLGISQLCSYLTCCTITEASACRHGCAANEHITNAATPARDHLRGWMTASPRPRRTGTMGSMSGRACVPHG